MKKTLIFPSLFLSVLLLGCVSENPQEGQSPRISVSPQSWDFGEMPQEKATKTFTLQNTGNSVLEITRVSTSCGCTTASVEKTSLQPYESTGLTVQFDPNAMEEPVLGNVLRIVYIKSNDPGQPELEIKLTANVVGASTA